MNTIAIIGGGASGLCTAACAARNFRKSGISAEILVLESNARVGKKLLATGNGRCNLMNENISLEHFHGDAKIAESVFSRCGVSEISDFFSSLGFLTHSDSEGRVYPYSNRSDTVLSTLMLACRRYGVKIITDFAVLDIKRYGDRLELISDCRKITALRAVIACGSSAGKGLGSSKGYELLDRMGIPYSPLFPSLTSISVSENISGLKGVRARGRASLLADGELIHSEPGELQFTEKALSGICVFNLSRYAGEFFSFGTIGGKPYKSLKIEVQLMPEYSFSEVCGLLRQRRKAFPDISCAELLSGIVDIKLARYISERLPHEALNESTIKRLAGMLLRLSFTPLKCAPASSAQAMAGGVTGEELELSTLAWRKDKRISLCGEILDVDGDCGGYNLSFAWASGMICGKAIGGG